MAIKQGKGIDFWVGYIRGKMEACAELSKDFGEFSRMVIKELKSFRMGDIAEALGSDKDLETFYYGYKEGGWQQKRTT